MEHRFLNEFVVVSQHTDLMGGPLNSVFHLSFGGQVLNRAICQMIDDVFVRGLLNESLIEQNLMVGLVKLAHKMDRLLILSFVLLSIGMQAKLADVP